MNRRGTTIISVMVTTCIIGLTIVPMASLLVTEGQQTRANRNRVFATHLARNMIERIRMERLEAMPLMVATEDDGKIFVAADEILSPQDVPASYVAMCKNFERTLVYKPAVDGDSGKGVIEAKVSWIEEGHKRTLQLSMLLIEEESFGGGK